MMVTSITNDALDKLPLFADDHDIAVAIVGKKRAGYFKSMLPNLERKGFPPKCPLHEGRPIFLVKLFYQTWFAPQANTLECRAASVNTAERRRVTDERWQESLRKKDEKKARTKATSDAWSEKKRKALEEFRAKKAAQVKPTDDS